VQKVTHAVVSSRYTEYNMQNVKNPVVNEKVADQITKTFVSALPKMPISMLSPKDLAVRMKENEESELDDVTKAKERLSLNKRTVLLEDRELNAGGWFNFGSPTAQMSYTPLPNNRGIQIALKNHRGEVVKCNLKNDGSNMYIANDIQTAMDIAETTNQNISFHTSSFGKWNASEWFDQAYVTLTPKKSK